MKTPAARMKIPRYPGVIRQALLITLLVILAIVVGFIGWMRYRDMSAAKLEADAQKPEVEECRKRLAGFYKAWTRYAVEHKGRFPGRYADLVPKYITDPNMLTCPTAERWIGKKAAMQSGSITANGKSYRVTYGFRVFAASYPIVRAKYGDRAVLVACDAHQEGMYRAVYHRQPQVSAFEATERSNLADIVRDTRQLVLRKNGVVDFETDEQ